MNEMKRIKAESYSADMSLREQAINDKEKVKRRNNSLKRKYVGAIEVMKLTIYRNSKAELMETAGMILKNNKLSKDKFKYIGLIN